MVFQYNNKYNILFIKCQIKKIANGKMKKNIVIYMYLISVF